MSKEKKTKEQKKLEKMERARKPFVSAWGYVGLSVLWFIPVLGWLIWFFNLFSKKTNKRSYARSKICSVLFLVIVVAILALALFLMVTFDIAPELTSKITELGLFKGYAEVVGDLAYTK
ncbi:MAG: hypothetical protein J6J66_08715 [Clostridia bacterium]|nr:hypothetical protein [Clostridia bacterium]